MRVASVPKVVLTHHVRCANVRGWRNESYVNSPGSPYLCALAVRVSPG